MCTDVWGNCVVTGTGEEVNFFLSIHFLKPDNPHILFMLLSLTITF